jgi:NADH-quinone oxidoreductase subunit J
MTFMGFVFSAIALAAALGVVFNRNPLYSAFSLIVQLLAMAGLYSVLGAHFLAVTQVVVYAGAIMVLVLFVLMLLNLKSESGRKLGIMKPLVALGVGFSVVATVFPAVVAQFKDISLMTLQENLWKSEGGVKAIGQEIYGRYIVQFELSSLVLLIGIVGAIMLSKRKRIVIGPREGGLGGKQ